MECAVLAASSDSEDSTTQEMDEQGAPSNAGQQGSLKEAAVESSTQDDQGSIGMALVNKAASTRKVWYSLDSVIAERGEKPPRKDWRNLVRFRKKDGDKMPVPHGLCATLTVNISEEAGITCSDSEDLTMQTMSEDEERALVTQEDIGETAEELKFQSSASEFGVSLKQNPRRSEAQRKRSLTENVQGPASKLVKSSEQPQQNQMPGAGTECGEIASDPIHWEQCGSIQTRHLEENYAAEGPLHCTQSTQSLIPGSEEVTRQEMQQCMPHNVERTLQCFECSVTFSSVLFRDKHLLERHHELERFTCPECSTIFSDAWALRVHRNLKHFSDNLKTFKCVICNMFFISEYILMTHWMKNHAAEKPFSSTESTDMFSFADYQKEFAVDEALDFPWEVKK